jgi:ankyrin repeat protein
LLHIAIGEGDRKKVEELLKNGANVLAVDENGFAPLHEAVRMGQIEAARLLLANGADVNAKSSKGTPLQLVLTSKMDLSTKIKLAGLLCHSGADVLSRDERNWTSVHYAALSESKEFLDVFLSLEVTRESGQWQCKPLAWMATRVQSDAEKLFSLVAELDGCEEMPLELYKRHFVNWINSKNYFLAFLWLLRRIPITSILDVLESKWTEAKSSEAQQECEVVADSLNELLCELDSRNIDAWEWDPLRVNSQMKGLMETFPDKDSLRYLWMRLKACFE